MKYARTLQWGWVVTDLQRLAVQLDAIETALGVAQREPRGPRRRRMLEAVGAATSAVRRQQQGEAAACQGLRLVKGSKIGIAREANAEVGNCATVPGRTLRIVALATAAAVVTGGLVFVAMGDAGDPDTRPRQGQQSVAVPPPDGHGARPPADAPPPGRSRGAAAPRPGRPESGGRDDEVDTDLGDAVPLPPSARPVSTPVAPPTPPRTPPAAPSTPSAAPEASTSPQPPLCLQLRLGPIGADACL